MDLKKKTAVATAEKKSVAPSPCRVYKLQEFCFSSGSEGIISNRNDVFIGRGSSFFS